MRYKDLKERLDKYNLDADYPKEYLHISWSLLRIILTKTKVVEK